MCSDMYLINMYLKSVCVSLFHFVQFCAFIRKRCFHQLCSDKIIITIDVTCLGSINREMFSGYLLKFRLTLIYEYKYQYSFECVIAVTERTNSHFTNNGLSFFCKRGNCLVFLTIASLKFNYIEKRVKLTSF